jgi:hypothetical protein
MKIGRTTNIQSRMYQLQRIITTKLLFFGFQFNSIEKAKQIETFLHDNFYKDNLYGEWFVYDRRIYQITEEICLQNWKQIIPIKELHPPTKNTKPSKQENVSQYLSVTEKEWNSRRRKIIRWVTYSQKLTLQDEPLTSLETQILKERNGD